MGTFIQKIMKFNSNIAATSAAVHGKTIIPNTGSFIWKKVTLRCYYFLNNPVYKIYQKY